MKREYDFSKGERGKFFRKEASLNLPIYLEPEQLKFVEDLAKKKKKDLRTIVNDIIKNSKKFANFLQ
jgi:hypothetical protein